MPDEVYRPDHYAGPVEAIEVIEAVVEGLPAREAVMLANVLRYALRAGRKGEAEAKAMAAELVAQADAADAQSDGEPYDGGDTAF